jgi:hypothetical protein
MSNMRQKKKGLHVLLFLPFSGTLRPALVVRGMQDFFLLRHIRKKKGLCENTTIQPHVCLAVILVRAYTLLVQPLDYS